MMSYIVQQAYFGAIVVGLSGGGGGGEEERAQF